MPKYILASGYFNPLHIGHLEYLRQARALGDKLFVIVNNDNQVRLKGSIPFQCLSDRIAIIRELRDVDGAFESLDEDKSVCQTIRRLHQQFGDDVQIFAKGGDRNAQEIPEASVCRELGIRIVDGLGDKIQSSSELLRKLNG